MKYKYENTIKIISMFALVLTMILMKIGNVSVQMFLAATSSIICIGGALLCLYKGFRLGAAFLFCPPLIGILVILSQHFDSYKLAALIPTVFILIIIFSYKLVVTTGDIEKIRNIKIKSIVGIILCSIIQIVMIIPLFIKI